MECDGIGERAQSCLCDSQSCLVYCTILFRAGMTVRQWYCTIHYISCVVNALYPHAFARPCQTRIHSSSRARLLPARAPSFSNSTSAFVGTSPANCHPSTVVTQHVRTWTCAHQRGRDCLLIRSPARLHYPGSSFRVPFTGRGAPGKPGPLCWVARSDLGRICVDIRRSS